MRAARSIGSVRRYLTREDAEKIYAAQVERPRVAVARMQWLRRSQPEFYLPRKLVDAGKNFRLVRRICG